MAPLPTLIAQVYWLTAAPALAAILHMFVVKLDLFSSLAVPIDRGGSLGGVRIFGDNKTWRGVVFMVAASAALGLVQGVLLGDWARRAGLGTLIDFAALGQGSLAAGYAIAGAAFGAGYALGELPNSFAKRRVAIPPGKTAGGALGAFFFVVDQVDSALVVLAIAILGFGADWRILPAGLLALGLLHVTLVSALYLLKVRRNL